MRTRIFPGFGDERGESEGEGFNLNLPLPEDVDGDRYRKSLASALQRVVDFNPVFLVVALGFDTAKGDPTGTWSLMPRDFETSGRMLGDLGLLDPGRAGRGVPHPHSGSQRPALF